MAHAPTLAALLAPLDLEAFAREHFGRRPAHAPGAPERHAALFSWAALERLLAAAPQPHPALRLYGAEQGFVGAGSAADAIAALRGGAALVVEEADRYDLALGALVDRIEAELDEPARVNVYATTPSAPGFPLHADTHDVFVLHLAGRKRWTLAGPSVPDPLYHPSLHPLPPPDPSASASASVVELELGPGDTLYLPRGHWHRAEAVGGPSLHLTLAVFFSTGIDLAFHVVDALFASPSARAAFPVAPGPALRGVSEHPEAHRAHLARVREALLSAIDDPALLDRFRAARLAARAPRRPYALPAMLVDAPADRGPDERVAVPPHGARWQDRPEAVEVQLPGRALSFPPGAGAVVRRAFSGLAFTRADLCAAAPDLDEAVVDAIFDGLVAEGVAR